MNDTTRPGTDGDLVNAILRARRLLEPERIGREEDVFYRGRWSHDRIVRSTHGMRATLAGSII